MPATTKPKGLYAKLAEITGLMANIKKEGFNKNQGYRFVRESDVAEKASELLSERGIFILQSVKHHGYEALYTTSRGQTMYLSEVTMGFQFIDGESGEKSDVVDFVGHGADTGDKGIYKAMTGAEKYFLMKTFLISTGDDPEADEKVDKEAAGAAAGAGSRIKGGKAKADTQKGGKTTGSTKAQTEELKRLIKDKKMTPVTLLIAVSEALDTPLSPGAEPKDVLAALSAEEMGKVIAYVAESVTIVDENVEELSEPDHDAGEDGEQEALDIV